MQNFIVLGIIPGTNYQTDFNFWLIVGLAFLAVINTMRMVNLLVALRHYLIARSIARSISNLDLVSI